MNDSLIDQNPKVTHDDPVDLDMQETLDVNVDDGNAPLRRSQRIHRHAISSNYVVYL